MRNPLLVLALLVMLPVPSHAQGSDDLSGSYAFHSRSTRGDPFDGTFHVLRMGGHYRARIYTTIDAPLDATRVFVTDSGMTMVAALGSREITFQLAVAGDSLSGRWTAGTLTQDIVGSRRSHDADLTPVPCRAPGLDEVIRCATRFVPENREDPESRRIPLNIVILPARQPSPAGALFHFAGGPGQAATEQAAGNARRFGPIRERRDVVMIDQRGTGHSNGLPCRLDDPIERTLLLFGGIFPRRAVEACRDTLSQRADLRFYHTAVAARDVDDVRGWLGYESIDLYGGSYGTRAALAYLRQYPGRVRTATLRGVLAPSGSLSLDNAKDAQASLDLLFHECETDARCTSAYPELEREFDSVRARLAQEPVAIRVRDPLTGDSVAVEITTGVFAGAVRRMLMDAELWRVIPSTIHRAARGDFGVLRTGIERTIGIASSLYWGMGISVVCAEDPPLIARRDIAAETGGSFMGGDQARALVALCPIWPAGTPPAGYDQPVRVDVPVLVLSGRLDPTTPPRWGEEVARALPRSMHLVMEGVSHAPFPECAVQVMADVVERGTVDGVDTSCVSTLTRGEFAVP